MQKLKDTALHLDNEVKKYDSKHIPQKINMEPENTPVEKEHNLNHTIIFRFYVNLLGLWPVAINIKTCHYSGLRTCR